MSRTATLRTKTHPTPAGAAGLLDEGSALGVEPGFADLLAPPPAPPKRGGRRRAVLSVLAFVAVAGIVAGVLYWMNAQRYESTDDATIEGRVITLSPQVAGRVLAVHVSDNTPVHKGDLLVELDPIDYQVALEQANASESAYKGKLTQAQAQVDSATASREEARAEITVADSNAQMAQSDHDRYVEASSRAGAISRQQLDTATAAWRSSEAQVQQAKAKLAAAQAQIATAQAAVEAARGDLAKATADVRRASVNLSYCRVLAPEDGRITRKNVEPGSYLQVGQSLFAIVPPEFWVVANFKETQLDRVRPGQSVSLHVDAYPDMSFTGKVESIQSGTGSRFSVMPPENATGNYVKVVQRVPVKIVFDMPTVDLAHPLAAGMSVTPQVKVE